MKLLRFGMIGESDQPLELDLADCAEIAAAMQERFPDVGAFDLLRNVFAALDMRRAAPEATLH